ncbi:hypothetical protein QFC21_003286 [Naganishia friedmannii]|uniref:Uncharacterized protein n=1 Tax=Naganishia friedmannii TaxID=89922 RepID=A0ACC2VPG9_9TREE|nr:hypothetical protein QFC21_003286 [Naganishia friedmannii]
MAEWSSSPERSANQARQVPSTSAAPRSRYLTRSATRKGTTSISHILLEQRPATVRAAKSSNTSLARNGGGSKARKPFIEALNRAAGTEDKEDNNASAAPQQDEKEMKAACSPAKPLPADRKRRISAFTSSPRGVENSPNTRPRKVARIPQLSAIRLSPLKPLNSRPVIRSDVSSSSDEPKLETKSSKNPSMSGATTSAPLFSVEQPTSLFKIESPAKVPVGSSTPFRYGTNRILDVPLSAIKKGSRWSLASDLSDDSLLLQASPKKATEQDRLLARDSAATDGARIPEGRQRLFPLDFGKSEDLGLGFLEDLQDNTQVNTEDQTERQSATTNISNSLFPSTSKLSLDRQRKSAPTQKTSAARIVQRAQKSLSIPRTTSSYAKPTQSSAKAASITAATINARTALENVIRRPVGKAYSTPVAEVASSSSTTPFSRPCGKQSRASSISYLGDTTLVGSTMNVAGAGKIITSPLKPFAKPAFRIPPNMEHRSPQKPLTAAERSIPQAPHTALQPVPTSAPNHARRKSLTMETSKSLYGLSAALAKLTVKRPSLEGKSPDTSLSGGSTLTKEMQADGRLTTDARAGTKFATLTADTAPRNPAQPITISRIPKSISIQGRNSLTRLAEVNRRISGEMQQPVADESAAPAATAQVSSLKPKIARGIFHGVTVFVDVRTAEGDDSSAVFVEMLRAGGARVLSKPTDNCTHVVFKSGKVSTLIWWRKQPLPKPHIVGIGWVTRSTELGHRAVEETFQVDVTAQAVFQKVKF